MTEALIVEMIDQDLHEPVQEERIKEMRRNQTAKARAVKAQKAQERGYRITNPPYGYPWGGDQLIPQPQELETIALAQQLRTNGFSYAKIAKILTANGHRNRNGNIFNHGNVRQMLNYKRKSLAALLPK